MHNESRKIERKRRIMSSEKQQRELSECSFTPKINHRGRKTRPKGKKLKTEDASKVSERMYEYADKHKSNLKKKKESMDQERGQEINFKPKIVETKTLKINREKGEVYDDLYKDFCLREDKKKEKKVSYGGYTFRKSRIIKRTTPVW